MTALSILDLVRVTQDTDARGALDNARDIAVHAEAWGYRRMWVAEHHNMPGIASAATSVVIGHIAAGTKTIRVGAGGIMLPNHAPYVIAEQFGTLAQLFPDRIDLGLGRAPGTDQLTLRALRRTPEAAENFPQDVLEVQAFLAPAGPNQRIQAVPIYDVLNATDYVTPALEILDTRIVRLDPTSKKTRSVVDTIADNAANAGIVTGGRRCGGRGSMIFAG